MQVSVEKTNPSPRPLSRLRHWLDPVLLFSLPLLLFILLGAGIQYWAPSEVPVILICGVLGVIIGNANLACWKHEQEAE